MFSKKDTHKHIWEPWTDYFVETDFIREDNGMISGHTSWKEQTRRQERRCAACNYLEGRRVTYP